MPVPTNKAELQEAILLHYTKLRQELQSIPSERTLDTDLEGHAKNTHMSICNIVSYLIGWGELVLKWIDRKDAGQVVDFPETGYKWNELGKLAQKFYQDYQSLSYEELCHQLDLVVHQILDIIASKSPEELYERSWYNDWPMGRMIQFNTSSPYSNARSRIRKWKKEQQIDRILN